MNKFKKATAIIIVLFAVLSLLAGCRKTESDIFPNIFDAEDATSAAADDTTNLTTAEIDESLPVTSTSGVNPAPTTVKPDAGSNEFITNSFDVDIRIVSNTSFAFTETIDVTYNAARHGIIRTIPLTGRNLKIVSGKKVDSDCKIAVSDIQVEGYEYSATIDGNEQIIKIGNPNVSVTGHFKYVIEYKCTIIKNGGEANQFYWNLLPSRWEVPIAKSSITILLPAKINKSHISFYGDVEYSYSVKNKTIAANIVEPFLPGDNLTVLIHFPDNFFNRLP